MIGVKVDKNSSKATVQKKPDSSAKSLSSAPVAQLCGNEDKDKKSDEGTFAPKHSFWTPETIQGKFEGGIKQLKSAPSFPTIQLKNTNEAIIQRVASSENKTGLPDNVKTGTERLSGISLSDVKVEYNSNKPAQLSAHAYAQGTNIFVGPGQEKHVPHEAWHVVQQKQGRVQATTQMKGMVPVNDDAGLEREADVMGAKAVQMVKIDEEEAPVQQKAIGNNGEVAQLGILDWLRGKPKKKEDDDVLKEKQIGTSFETINPIHINTNTEDKEVETRSNSVIENKKSWFNKASDWMGEKKDSLVKGAGEAYDWMGEKKDAAGAWLGEKKDSLVKGAGEAYDWMGEKKDAANAWMETLPIGHNKNRHTRDTKKDGLKYAGKLGKGIIDLTNVSTKAVVLGVNKISTFMHNVGEKLGLNIKEANLDNPFKDKNDVLTQAGQNMAVAGAVMGGVSSMVAGYQAGKQFFSNGADKNTKKKAGFEMLSSVAGGVSSAGTLMGGVAVGALGVVTGAIDMLKGYNDGKVADNRKESSDRVLIQVLNAIFDYYNENQISNQFEDYGSAEKIVADGNWDALQVITNAYANLAGPKASEYKTLSDLASHLSVKQKNIKNSSQGTMIKGGLSIAGGALAIAGIALASTVAGAATIATGGTAILGIAAVVGLGLLINDYIKKGKNRKEVAMKHFNIKEKAQKDYENKYEQVIGGTFSKLFTKDSTIKKSLQENNMDEKSPLDTALSNNPGKSYESINDWYADYVKDKGNAIKIGHYDMGQLEYVDIIKNLGFKTKEEIDADNPGKDPKPYPSAKQIAKAISE